MFTVSRILTTIIVALCVLAINSAGVYAATLTSLETLVIEKNSNILLTSDINTDNMVDRSDLIEICKIYNTDITEDTKKGDVNGDYVIDVSDIAIVSTDYGTTLFAKSSVSEGETAISIEPSFTRIEPENDFQIDVDINTTESVYAISVTLYYDTSIMNFSGISEGNFLKKDGQKTYPVVDVDYENGAVFFDSTRYDTIYGVSGDGTIFILTFDSIAEGTGQIEITDMQIIDENMFALPDENISIYNGTVEVNINDNPVITPIGNKVMQEGSLFSLEVEATDADGDAVTLNQTSGPGTLIGTIYNYTAPWDTDHDNEIYTVGFEAHDDYGGSDTESFQLTVNDINRDPTVNAIADKNVDEGQTLTFAVSGSDPESDTLSYSVVSGPGSILGTTYSYTPGWDTNHSDEISSVVIEATDGHGGYGETSFQLNVSDVNRVPSIDSYIPTDTTPEMDEGTSLFFSVTASDGDSDTLTYEWKLNGTIVSSISSYTYNPSYDDSGVYTVLATVSDGYDTDTQTWTVTVDDVEIECSYDSECGTDDYLGETFCSADEVHQTYRTYTCNNPGTGDSYCSHADTEQTIEVCGYKCISGSCVANVAPTIDSFLPSSDPTTNETASQGFSITASDIYGDPLTTTWKLDDAVVGTGTSYSYVPDYDSAGIYTVLATVSDGELYDTHSWTLTVLNVNRAPEINSYLPTDTTPEIDEGESITFSASASDPDGDSVSYSWKLEGVEVSTAQSFSYTTGYSDSGTYNVALTVSDGNGGTDTQSWTLTVNDVDTIDVQLYDGVNNGVELPAEPVSSAIEDVLSTIDGSYCQVQVYDDGEWKKYTPNNRPGECDITLPIWYHDTLTKLDESLPFNIRMIGDAVLTVDII
ncbi:MAG: PKD domain-containing protein [Candidatus Aenigmarchaeota archaeon]|nr:PKD domain-containing protein [Candidatus Aenigmarchaeota archaeon]